MLADARKYIEDAHNEQDKIANELKSYDKLKLPGGYHLEYIANSNNGIGNLSLTTELTGQSLFNISFIHMFNDLAEIPDINAYFISINPQKVLDNNDNIHVAHLNRMFTANMTEYLNSDIVIQYIRTYLAKLTIALESLEGLI